MIKKKVMIIDETQVSTAMSSLFLNDENFEVIDISTSENEALNKLSKIKPDLIILESEIFKNGLKDFFSKISLQSDTKIIVFPSKNSNEEILDNRFTVINKPKSLSLLHKNYGVGKNIITEIRKLFGIRDKTKVMIVDDAALMRAIIFKVLNSDSKIEIIGTATNGQEALSLLSEKNPDVILLDIEMPVMNGLEFLRHARLKSKAKIIVLSSVTTQGSPKASQALTLGAEAIITKPSGSVSIDLADKTGSLILNTIHRVYANA